MCQALAKSDFRKEVYAEQNRLLSPKGKKEQKTFNKMGYA